MFDQPMCFPWTAQTHQAVINTEVEMKEARDAMETDEDVVAASMRKKKAGDAGKGGAAGASTGADEAGGCWQCATFALTVTLASRIVGAGVLVCVLVHAHTLTDRFTPHLPMYAVACVRTHSHTCTQARAQTHTLMCVCACTACAHTHTHAGAQAARPTWQKPCPRHASYPSTHTHPSA